MNSRMPGGPKTFKEKWDTERDFRRKVTKIYIALAVGGYIVYKIVTKPKKALYSYGVDSIWKVKATEEEISAFNRVLEAFYCAQDKLMKAGTPWDTRAAIKLYTSRKDVKAYNDIGKRMNKSLKKINQDKNPIDIFEDYLVKN
jgi:hypothetical protein